MGTTRRNVARGAAEAEGASADDGAAGYASPACFLHEVDPSYLGYLGRDEVIEFLRRLLEAERARGKGLLEFGAAGRGIGSSLGALAREEARLCTMLGRHIRRLGGRVSRRTGGFLADLAACDDLPGRLALLTREHSRAVREIDEALPRIADDSLHADLRKLRAFHERAAALCAGLGSEEGATRKPPRRRG